MSSYICPTKTYKDIYTGLHRFDHPTYSYSKRAIEELFDFVTVPGFDCDPYATALNALYSLNVDAVNQRYNEKNNAHLAMEKLQSMCVVETGLSPIQFVKSLECLHYQMSEGTIPEQSKLYAYVEKLISALCKDIVHTSKLYDKAVWG